MDYLNQNTWYKQANGDNIRIKALTTTHLIDILKVFSSDLRKTEAWLDMCGVELGLMENPLKVIRKSKMYKQLQEELFFRDLTGREDVIREQG